MYLKDLITMEQEERKLLNKHLKDLSNSEELGKEYSYEVRLEIYNMFKELYNSTILPSRFSAIFGVLIFYTLTNIIIHIKKFFRR